MKYNVYVDDKDDPKKWRYADTKESRVEAERLAQMLRMSGFNTHVVPSGGTK